MDNYDKRVSFSKSEITDFLLNMKDSPERHRLATLFDNLNLNYDALLNALVRQRRERDNLISNLLNQLADRML